jgi:hypothetical protein
MSRMEGGVAIKTNEAGHEQSDLGYTDLPFLA